MRKKTEAQRVDIYTRITDRIVEDLGLIPSFADWVKAIRPEPWMGRTRRIEKDLEADLPA